MIIVDFNQVMISNLMTQLGNHTNVPLEEGLFRHMVINSIRSYRLKFGAEYGELVIACDDKNYWRKKVFPYYKANRKKNREASEINWTTVFNIFDKIKQELREYFPYRVIQVESAEADDIIATLVHHSDDDKILILSGDKDFVQLQTDSRVDQYDPVRKKWVKHDNPGRYLSEHILKGDTGDGIPNVLSDDDTFVANKRQKPLTQKKIDNLLEGEHIPNDMLRNYQRNKQVVDLSLIPLDISTQIIDKYNSESGKGREKIFVYFMLFKLKHLMENLSDF